MVMLSEPKYLALENTIRNDVKRGKYKSGQTIPSESQFMREYNISANTVQKAINKLVYEGLLYRIQGKGTFVADRKKIGAKPGSTKRSKSSRDNCIQAILYEPNFFIREFNPLNWFISLNTIKGILDACTRFGYSVRIVAISMKDDIRSKRSALFKKSSSGTIFIQASGYRELIDTLIEKPYPFVIARGVKKEKGFSSVIIDREKGIYDGMQHLLKLGHKRIGFVGGESSNPYNYLKLSGYKKALEKEGISPEDKLIIECGGGVEESYSAVFRLLDLKNFPTAIVFGTDLRAIGGIKAIKERGLSIPRDMAIIGFDDIPEAAQVEPSLTTLHAPNYESGFEATKSLLDLIEGKRHKPKDIILPMKLVIRKSCGNHLDYIRSSEDKGEIEC